MASSLVATVLLAAVVPAIGGGSHVRVRDFEDDKCTIGGSWAGFTDGHCNAQPDGTSTIWACHAAGGVKLSVFAGNACGGSPTATVDFPTDSSCTVSHMASCFTPATATSTSKFVKFRDFDDDACTTGGLEQDIVEGYCNKNGDGTSTRFTCRPNGVDLEIFADGACGVWNSMIVDFTPESPCKHSMKAVCVERPAPASASGLLTLGEFTSNTCGASSHQVQKFVEPGACTLEGAASTDYICENAEVVQNMYSDTSCKMLVGRTHFGSACLPDGNKWVKPSCPTAEIKQYMKVQTFPSAGCSGVAEETTIMPIGCTRDSEYNRASSSWMPKSRGIAFVGGNLRYQTFNSLDCSGTAVADESQEQACGSCFQNGPVYRKLTCFGNPADTASMAISPGMSLCTAAAAAVAALLAK